MSIPRNPYFLLLASTRISFPKLGDGVAVRIIPFALILFGSSWVYGALPPRWQWRLRLGLALLHVVTLSVLAVLAPILGWHGGAYGINIMLIVAPITVMSWSFLFYDQPRLGRLLGLLLSLSASGLVAHWLFDSLADPSLALLILISCVLASEFGWNVTKLQRRALRGEKDARQDALASLLNRRAFDEALSQTWPPGLLAVMDIDHFKVVNDTYGHYAGDRVLRAVGDVLLDILPEEGRAFRWGGEEFVLLLPGLTPEQALSLLEKIRAEIAQRTFIGGTHVTLSAGVSAYGEQPLPAAFIQADAALLRAKRGGRNQVVSAPTAQGVSH